MEKLAQMYLINDPVQFSDKEIKLCFKLTKGYPYFVQRLFHTLYDLKKNNNSQKDFSRDLKEKYKTILKDTIVGWGGVTMAERTKSKLYQWLNELIPTLGKVVISTIQKILIGRLTNP